MKQTVLVVGLGEIGTPLYELIAAQHQAIGIDLRGNRSNFEVDFDNLPAIDVMHVCFPFDIKPGFEEITISYMKKYGPVLTILNSTIPPGTTKNIYDATDLPAVHSPVRGRHTKMRGELRTYTKFVGSPDIEFSQLASEHFQSLGLRTRIASSARATELMKLLSTTYYGLLRGWAQEMNRVCKKFDCDYDEIMEFAEEIDRFIGRRPKYEPRIITGHCVTPNAKMLSALVNSDFIAAFLKSDELRRKELKEDEKD